jgi:CubicO group peptidase (beta-lactamase class C family)
MRFRAPSEGLLSTAEDLAGFGNAIMNSDRISENIKNRLFQQQELLGDIPASMANGWMLLQSNKGEKWYGRTGAVTGGGSAIVILPEKNLVIAGMVNLTSNIDEIPVFQMLSPLLKEDKKEENSQKK